MTDVGRRAEVVGTGLIGGSIGLALRQRGWRVAGVDLDESRSRAALSLGAIDEIGADPAAELTFVATPVGVVADSALALLGAGRAVVTDVGSVKAPIVGSVAHANFVGGHPMAGSEQEGIEAARAELFEGATWVLTPTGATDEAAYATVRAAVSSMGAEVIAVEPDRHDRLVAMVSHVPHLTAASLMCLADERAEEHRALLRLAAGGFRDMTRVAASHPGIWPDICAENQEAIVDVLDQLIEALGDLRAVVADDDRAGLVETLERARMARTNLPARFGHPGELAELRIPIPDRPGALAEITTTATDLDINIANLDLAHSAEGSQGVLIVVVEEQDAAGLQEALVEVGYSVVTGAMP